LAASAIDGVGTSYLAAQYAPAPETYSITQLRSLLGPTIIERIWRDGSKTVIEWSTPSAQPGGKRTHVRSFYDLPTPASVSWDPTDPAPQCSTGRFGGDRAIRWLRRRK
jgi:hypothetical protein